MAYSFISSLYASKWAVQTSVRADTLFLVNVSQKILSLTL